MSIYDLIDYLVCSYTSLNLYYEILMTDFFAIKINNRLNNKLSHFLFNFEYKIQFRM